VRRLWFQAQETEKVEVAQQLDAFDTRLHQMQQLTPRLNQSWRSHIPLAPPAIDYRPVPTPAELGPSDAQLEKAFRLIDKSGDQVITFTEFIKAMRTDAEVAKLVGGSRIQDAFRRMDTDGSMRVDMNEFKTFVRKLHGDGGKRIVLTPRR